MAESSSSTTPPSKVTHRAFVTNTYSGAMQIMDTQNDTTPYTAQTTNSAGQVVPGVPVTISVGNSLTWAVVSSDLSKTLVFDPSDNFLYVITNSTEAIATSVQLAGAASMGLFSPDGNTAYIPVRTAPYQR